MDKIRISMKVEVKHPSFFERLARLRRESVAVIENLPGEDRASAHQAHDGDGLGELRLMTRRESEWEAYMNPFKFVLRNAWVRICLTDSIGSLADKVITGATHTPTSENKLMSEPGGYPAERAVKTQASSFHRWRWRRLDFQRYGNGG